VVSAANRVSGKTAWIINPCPATPPAFQSAMQVACDESKGDAFILFVSDVVNSGGTMPV
jgi:hypothetical protein